MGYIKKVTPAEGQVMLENRFEIVLLDVRNPEEYREGHLPKAVNVPLDYVESSRVTVYGDHQQPVMVYCHGGYRSAMAARMLMMMGYEEIYDLGGIVDWPFETVSE